MRRRSPGLTNWQRRCLAQLRASANQQPDSLRVLDNGNLDEEAKTLLVPFALNTSEIEVDTHGLPLGSEESFILAIGPDGEHAPAVYVEHFRFLGHPHVLSGFLLCLYLDETREWDPAQGINGGPNGVLNRLWRWLNKAAKAQFNAEAALYHAVGGLPHLSRADLPLPPIVVRELPQKRGCAAAAWLTRRSDWCLQMHTTRPGNDETGHTPVFFTERDLPFGAGRDYLYELTTRLDLHQHQEIARLLEFRRSPFWGQTRPAVATPITDPQLTVQSQSVAMLTALAASAARKPDGTPQTLFLAVPHPIGGPRHLIAVYFEAALADRLRSLVRKRSSPLVEFDKAQLDRKIPLKWCYISDERPEVTTRRDTGRPVTAYQGANVLVWGVGGIGSWIAEFIGRAGPAKLIVCDNGIVTGGLLARQNYTDHDIGAPKADRLAARLRAIATTTDIDSQHEIEDDELQRLSTSMHLIIDATINRAVARRLETIATSPHRTAVIAQVATNVGTGCLGLAMVHGLQQRMSIVESDASTGRTIDAEPSLEPYRVFWKDPEPGDEFIPTRGCSLPTFHGSAADLAAVAASLATLIAPHLHDGASGTHLMALPHSGVTPPYQYIPHSRGMSQP